MRAFLFYVIVIGIGIVLLIPGFGGGAGATLGALMIVGGVFIGFLHLCVVLFVRK